MSIQSIQDRLNKEFTISTDRLIIFWYDDATQYADEIDTVHLQNAKLHKLTRTNTLATKYLLEKTDTGSSYLVYAPFARPDDLNNPLADTVHYARLFSAERVDAVCYDLGNELTEPLRRFLKRYPLFWTERNEQQFRLLVQKPYTEESLGCTLLAAAVKCRIADFSEILKEIIIDTYVTGKTQKFSSLETYKLTGLFWQFCNEKYGYDSGQPTLEKLIASLLITHAAESMSADLPASYMQYILDKKKNSVLVYITNLMSDSGFTEAYNKIALQTENLCKIKTLIAKYPIEQYADAYTFEAFDSFICKRLAGTIIETNAPLSGQYMDILAERSRKTHYSDTYGQVYRAIDRAHHVLLAVGGYEKESVSAATVEQIVQLYVEKWNKIDRYYRQFYTAFDLLDCETEDDQFYKLRSLVENVYTNRYLNKLCALWSEKLVQLDDFSKLPGLKQWKFFTSKAQLSAASECTVVIISDAFRYECGSELAADLNRTSGVSAELSYMTAAVPSYTKLCMAALLPHKNLTYSDQWNITVDGISSDGTQNRRAILQAACADSDALNYTDVSSMNRTEIRKVFAGKKLVYIYHNQIDARGESAASENEVFTAAGEAVKEIKKLIAKLSSDRSIGKYYVTADHGFIYKRDRLAASDKMRTGSLPEAVEKDNRFILSHEKPEIDGTLTCSLDYLDGSLAYTYVTVPCGADIFAFQGGGQNYVHGGASLQEIIVPLLTVETQRGSRQPNTVELDLMPMPQKITNLINYIKFMQKDNTGETLQPARVKVWFEDADQRKISNETTIIADRKDASPDDRVFTEKFTFLSRKYNKAADYYLVISDLASGIEIKRYKFTIDIAFADDFGF
ncbi:MAG: BREX-1 system phosphatase PglZ type A [Treponema sp.]